MSSLITKKNIKNSFSIYFLIIFTLLIQIKLILIFQKLSPMKTKVIQLSVILLIGISMSFYACSKKDKDVVGDANLTGIIIDSQTGLGLANASLYFKKDLNAADYNNADYTTITNANGEFSLKNAVAGNYKCFVVSEGFFVRIITGIVLVSGENTLETVTLVSAPNEGSYRIVLSWGESPEDLDSHLTGPDGSGGRFHMYYSDQDPNENVSLDVDDTESYGPETTTITNVFNGMYRFSVHNYSDRYLATGGSGIVSSPAKVELYDHTGLLHSYNPPAFNGNGDTWRVFEIIINGSTTTINTVNTYILCTDDDDTNQFKNNKKQKTHLDSRHF